MTTMNDHRHGPWRAIAAVVHHTRHGEHATTVEVADAAEGPSIAEWLATGDRQPTTAEASPTHIPAAGFWPTPGRPEVRPHREFDDDTELATALLAMERETQALADTLAGENDTRLELLLARFHRLDESVGAMVSACNRAWEALEEQLLLLVVTRRRRNRIRPLVQQLGALVQVGDVAPETAAAVVNLRARWLGDTHADSQRIPKMTREKLAELDRTLGMRRPQAPGSTVAA
jgi:hypothetical protein